MAILIKARCQVIQPNWRIVKYFFDDIERNKEQFGEYIAMNLLRDRGVLHDGRNYLITIEPLFPH